MTKSSQHQREWPLPVDRLRLYSISEPIIKNVIFWGGLLEAKEPKTIPQEDVGNSLFQAERSLSREQEIPSVGNALYMSNAGMQWILRFGTGVGGGNGSMLRFGKKRPTIPYGGVPRRFLQEGRPAQTRWIIAPKDVAYWLVAFLRLSVFTKCTPSIAADASRCHYGTVVLISISS